MVNQVFIQVIFAIFALVAVTSAFLVITLNNPVRCVLCLVLAFIATAGMWILTQAEFLALVLVLVYVGAVMTLFLFVVMMININTTSLKYHFVRYLPFGVLIVALLVALMITAIQPEHFNAVMKSTPILQSEHVSNTQQLGLVLYTTYAYALELAAVLLLIAIVSAIVLVHRKPRNSKQQDIVKQLLVNSKDRLKLVKMSAIKQDD